MQTRVPFGYKIVEGRVVVNLEAAGVVRMIFSEYLSGVSTNQLAQRLKMQGILNSNGTCAWHHGRIGQLLENPIYLGDDFYPAIINQTLFNDIQCKRREQAQRLGRTFQLNRYDRKAVFSDKLVCGGCGGFYRRYIKTKGVSEPRITWKCKHYLDSCEEVCRRTQVEEQWFIKAFVYAVNQIISGAVRINKRNTRRDDVQPYKVRRLTEQIQEMEKDENCAADLMVALIYERAREQYNSSTVKDDGYQQQKMEQALINRDSLTEFEEPLFKEIVSQMTINGKEGITVHFINGMEVKVPYRYL